MSTEIHAVVQNSQDNDPVFLDRIQEKVSRPSHATDRMRDSIAAVSQMVGVKQLSNVLTVMAAGSIRVVRDIKKGLFQERPISVACIRSELRVRPYEESFNVLNMPGERASSPARILVLPSRIDFCGRSLTDFVDQLLERPGVVPLNAAALVDEVHGIIGKSSQDRQFSLIFGSLLFQQ
jgi:hypothetical protein